RFTTLNGQPRSLLGRLNVDGSLDTLFNPGVTGFNDPSNLPVVLTLVQQADSKLLVAGIFRTLGGQSCTNLGRLNLDGSFDSTFAAGLDIPQFNGVLAAVQADGKPLVGGVFEALGGQPRENIGRLSTRTPAIQTLTINAAGTEATWSRSGSA